MQQLLHLLPKINFLIRDASPVLFQNIILVDIVSCYVSRRSSYNGSEGAKYFTNPITSSEYFCASFVSEIEAKHYSEWADPAEKSKPMQ